MPAKEENLHELLISQLKDIYSAEKQISKSLPKMAKKVTDQSLAEAFQMHLEQTEGQIERLDKIAELLGKRLTGKKCVAMEGLINEGKEIMEEWKKGELLDAALISAAQKVEHYEIASYGTVATYAEMLGLDEVKDLLGETLEEEKETDEKLTTLAEDINRRTKMDGDEDEEEDDDEDDSVL